MEDKKETVVEQDEKLHDDEAHAQKKEKKNKHKEQNKYGTTCGLLMRLCKTLYSTGTSLFLIFYVFFQTILTTNHCTYR